MDVEIYSLAGYEWPLEKRLKRKNMKKKNKEWKEKSN